MFKKNGLIKYVMFTKCIIAHLFKKVISRNLQQMNGWN